MKGPKFIDAAKAFNPMQDANGFPPVRARPGGLPFRNGDACPECANFRVLRVDVMFRRTANIATCQRTAPCSRHDLTKFEVTEWAWYGTAVCFNGAPHVTN